MKRAYLVNLLLGLFLCNPTSAQEKNPKVNFREINRNETNISDTDVRRISNLEGTDGIKTVSITQIENLQNIINEDQLNLLFSSALGRVNVKKTGLTLNSLEDFV